MSQEARVAAIDRVGALFEEREEVGIQNYAVLDDFGHAGRELTSRQRVEHRRVDQHTDGLMKCSEHVFAAG